MKAIMIILVLSSIIAVLAILAIAYGDATRCKDQPCSSSEVHARLLETKIHMPVYAASLPGARVSSEYYYYYNGSDPRLTTVFVYKDQASSRARLVTSGFMGDLDGALTHSKEIRVIWADESKGITCDVLAGNYVNDSLPDHPYQTCMLWRSSGYWFRFYSTVSLDESLDLVNSLIKVE